MKTRKKESFSQLAKETNFNRPGESLQGKEVRKINKTKYRK